jgi:hypothetical protein
MTARAATLLDAVFAGRLLTWLTGGTRRLAEQSWTLDITSAEVEADLRHGRDEG